MRYKDASSGYGVVSIALHWITGAVVIVLWFIGNSLPSVAGPSRDQYLRLHTSIAISFYVFLWARVIWRLRSGHPGPALQQKKAFFYIGRATHLVLVVAIALMLISGPIMAWSGGLPLQFGRYAIPSPLPVSPWVFRPAHAVHVVVGSVIALLAAIHIVGALKHAAFDKDGTLDKILIPAKEMKPAARHRPF